MNEPEETHAHLSELVGKQAEAWFENNGALFLVYRDEHERRAVKFVPLRGRDGSTHIHVEILGSLDLARILSYAQTRVDGLNTQIQKAQEVLAS